jgi:hypothetical protein
MDIHDITAELLARPGQVPDVDESESRATRLVRSTLFDNPGMVALYRAQGLPVDALTGDEAWILEPEGDGGGPPVLYEAGALQTGEGGDLATTVTGDHVRLRVGPAGPLPRGGVLELELVHLRSPGVQGYRYTLPAPEGRLSFLLPREAFGLRSTLYLINNNVRRPLVFGPRLLLPRAK